MSFHQLFEDPTYDDDGNCVDEDQPLNEQEVEDEIYSPYYGA